MLLILPLHHVFPLMGNLIAPLATGGTGQHVIGRSGRAANIVANGLQRRLAEDTFALALGPWVRGGAATAVDRQLGLGYGAAAVRAIRAGEYGTMVAEVASQPSMVWGSQASASNGGASMVSPPSL